MIYTVKKRLPSGSHNASCDEEGYHWPVGERFKIHKRGHPYNMACKFKHLEQIGGEEVILCISQRLIDEHFEKEGIDMDLAVATALNNLKWADEEES